MIQSGIEKLSGQWETKCMAKSHATFTYTASQKKSLSWK